MRVKFPWFALTVVVLVGVLSMVAEHEECFYEHRAMWIADVFEIGCPKHSDHGPWFSIDFWYGKQIKVVRERAGEPKDD